MYRFMFSLLTDPLGLPIHALWEYGILSAIGAVAFVVGWQVSPGGDFGAVIHWGARLLTFLVLWAVAYALIAIVQWAILHWLLAVTVLAMLVIVIFAVVY